MKTFLLFCFCLFAAFTTSLAQGYKYKPGELEGIPRMRVPAVSKGIGDDAPIQVSNDLTAYCPAPYNQGKDFTCVVSAINGAYAIENAFANNGLKNTQKITNQFALSPVYPYQFIANSCGKGVDFDTMWKVLKENGNVPLIKTGNKSRCNDMLPKIEAKDIVKLSPDSVVVIGNDRSEDKVRKILFALSRNRPVVVGMQIRSNFSDTKRRYVIDPKFPQLREGHAVVAVGFDPKEEEIKFLNSYGSGFGENGFFYMKYADVGKETLRAFTVRRAKSGTGELSNSVSLKIQHYKEKDSEPDYPLIHYNGGNVYSFGKTVWTVDKDKFQITGGREMNGWHIGVINKNPEGKVKIIYPKKFKKPAGTKGLDDEELEDFFTLNSYIPDPETAMDVKSPAGTDYLCILMSPLPLRSSLMSLVNSAEVKFGRNFVEVVKNHLQKKLIRRGIKYLPNEAGFTIEKNIDGEIAVMFLKIESQEK